MPCIPARRSSGTHLQWCMLVPFLLLAPSIAAGQSFTPNHLTSTLTVPLAINALEYPRDPFGTVNPTPPTGWPYASRIVANLNQRYRVMANPWVRTAIVDFSHFNMDMTPVNGVSDHVDFDWFYTVLPTSKTGNQGATSLAPPMASGADSLAFPGMIFRVVTSQDSARGSPTAEHESWGFRTTQVRLVPNGTIGSSIVPTLSPFDDTVIVLAPSDDIVTTAVFNTTLPITLAAFYSSGVFANGVRMWARCGAPPTATNFVSPNPLVAAGSGTLLELGSCASNWFVSFTNVDPNPQVVRVIASAHFSSRDMFGGNVGISWLATAGEVTSIQQYFREAAWRFYGLSGGTMLLRNFRYFNNANQCDDGWPVDQAACSGSWCRFCLTYNCPRSYTRYTDGMVMLCGQNGAQWQNPAIIAHEATHSIYMWSTDHAADEYSPGFPATFQVSDCNNTTMADTANCPNTYCASTTHRRTVWDTASSPATSIAGPTAFWPGNSDSTHPDTMWDDMYNYGWVPFAYPVSGPAYLAQNPSAYAFGGFYTNTSLGSPL
jgi:hypothetical protein